jgi:sulfatase modifying factor 1
MSTKTAKPRPAKESPVASPVTQRLKTGIIIGVPLVFVIAVGFAMGWFIHKPAAEQAVFQPTRDTSPPPAPAPEGMTWIPGGSFWMGCDDPRMPDARPVHAVALDGFWMDQTPVTNIQYAKFVEETKYVTVAEKTPNPKDYPGVPAGQLVPGACVFSPPKSQVALNDISKWWRFAAGTSWRHPDGPDSDIASRMDHPVVQLAYEDAEAYATWAKKRLPTEAEYEYAARGGLDRQKYSWGDEFRPGGKWMANIFQGRFPDHNTCEDGYAGTSPVRAFPANGFGLYDMGGNVWQWCSDWYRPDTYGTLAETGDLTRNPTGPMVSHDPMEPGGAGIKKRVTRGGSFLCSDQYCVRFLVGSRGKTAIDTGTANVGFRCVKSK